MKVTTKTKNKAPFILSLVTIGLIYLFSMHQFEVWNFGIIGGGDTWGYYMYLPATFIHHDLDSLDRSIAARKLYHPGHGVPSEKNPLGSEALQYLGEGKYVSKYTLGLSLLYLPFFLLAQFLASLLDYPPDGYSFIYIYLIHLSSIVYVLIGLFFLQKVLRFYYSNRTALVVLFVISLATNLFYFGVYNSAMAHAYLFFLYCMLLYFTMNWHRDGRLVHAIGIGITCGLITLIRPTEMICIVIPIFWGLFAVNGVKKWFTSLFYNRQFYVAILFFLLMGVPQLLYWKWATGNFLFYSYTDESFNFLEPELLNGLFSYKNGWLAYTPVMYLALLGILFLSWKKDFQLPTLLFLPIHIYITYSWWCWNYINGFGSRPMVEAYALLSLPLAASVQWLFSFRLGKYLAILTLSFFTFLNLFNTYQLSIGVLWSEDANWNYYKSIFGKTKMSKADLIVYDSNEPQPDTTKLQFNKQIYFNNFEDATSRDYLADKAEYGNYCFALTNSRTYSPDYSFNLRSAGVQTGDWLKLSVRCMRTYEGNSIHHMSLLVGSIMNKDETIKWRAVRLDNKPGNTANGFWGGKPNIWGRVDFWFRVSEVNEGDIFKTYVWNKTTHVIYLDNHEVSHYSSK